MAKKINKKELEELSKERLEREKNEQAFNQNLKFKTCRNNYIKNTINGRYYLARLNMLADQINSGEIKEKIDGCEKTMDYMRAEYALMKMQAITSLRNSHFAKQDLLKDFGLTDQDVVDIEEDYYNGKVIREDYDESYKKRGKAEFVAEQ